MRILFKYFLFRLRNQILQVGYIKYLLFLSFGFLILSALTFLFIKLFGFIYHEDEFPYALKLFLSEKILLMAFITIFLMLIISSLTATLNVLFLSKDLRLLFASPLSFASIFFWKTLESIVNSSILVILFSLPVITSYCYYFSFGILKILMTFMVFLLFICSGALIGILIGLIIPLAFSLNKLQPILSVVTVSLISTIIIFIRLMKPEQFGDPNIVRNIIEYMSQFQAGFLDILPFAWISKSFTAISNSQWAQSLVFFLSFLGIISLSVFFSIPFSKQRL